VNKNAFRKISYGLYIISSKLGDKNNGQIANVVTQVSSDPQTLSICLNKSNLTHEFIEKSKVFAVSVLSRKTPFSFIGTFGFKSGKNTDKFKGVNFRIGKTGAPIVTDHSVAFLEAEVVGTLDAGTHTIFLGKVVDAEVLNDEEPMTYEYYHDVLKGKTEKNAPTYVDEKKI
jgi:ferric-chelate reductase [NAD(P)H]